MVDQPLLSTIESSLQGKSNIVNNTKKPRDDSPIAQVRSYVEKQMDQLQQDLEFGFPRTPKAATPPSITQVFILGKTFLSLVTLSKY
jgi:hypothetical protein